MRMNCRPTDLRAASIIIVMLVARLTLSIKTSNSSRHLMGEPTASQMLRRRQMVEKDFSPPLRVLVARPASEARAVSGSTLMSSSLFL